MPDLEFQPALEVTHKFAAPTSITALDRCSAEPMVKTNHRFFSHQHCHDYGDKNRHPVERTAERDCIAERQVNQGEVYGSSRPAARCRTSAAWASL